MNVPKILAEKDSSSRKATTIQNTYWNKKFISIVQKSYLQDSCTAAQSEKHMLIVQKKLSAGQLHNCSCLTKSYLKTHASSSKNLNTEHYCRTGKKTICTSSWINSLPSYTFSHSWYKGNAFAWNFLSLGWSWQMQTKVSSIVTS